MTESEHGVAVAARDGQTTGPLRVVLRCQGAVLLDNMTTEQRVKLGEVLGEEVLASYTEAAWTAVAIREGTVETSVKSYAGQSGTPDAKPGTYKALPMASWQRPAMVIEPPLP